LNQLDFFAQLFKHELWLFVFTILELLNSGKRFERMNSWRIVQEPVEASWSSSRSLKIGIYNMDLDLARWGKLELDKVYSMWLLSC